MLLLYSDTTAEDSGVYKCELLTVGEGVRTLSAYVVNLNDGTAIMEMEPPLGCHCTA